MIQVDLAVIGAGPAGMAAAMTACAQGVNVLVLDDQPSPGGQIWRNIEAMKGTDAAARLGDAFVQGRAIVEQFRASGCSYQPGSKLWHIEAFEGKYRLFFSRDGKSQSLIATQVILATGAQERPAPFPGWTLPGVMTVGAAQILLKTADQIPQGQVWLAGAGPLVLLYATQLLAAGGEIAGIISLNSPAPLSKRAGSFGGALRNPMALAKGLGWQASLSAKRVKIYRNVKALNAGGETRLTQITFEDSRGNRVTMPADSLLVHQGLVPSLHIPMVLNCRITWSEQGQCFIPETDDWGQTSLKGLYVVGDGAGIAGAIAAGARGQIAGLAAAQAATHLSPGQVQSMALKARRTLSRELGLRRFLDLLYRPASDILNPPEDTIICRCEEITAGQIRLQAAAGCQDANHMKALTRIGMGPCQGRQCGLSLAHLMANTQTRPIVEIGIMRIRPPLKPLTLAELAALDDAEQVQ